MISADSLRVLSGAVHYFRSLPEQWPDIMQSLRAMGLDTVETYLAWNVHEPREGRWERLDEVRRFLDCAQTAGLRTIVRPGPYICAEWDNGGLPSWLTGRFGRRVRSSDPGYLAAVETYFDHVVPLFADHPSLLMVQVENEYGSFGTDHAYLAALADGLRRRGVTVPLVTSDGWTDACLTGGTIPGIPATVNFGSDAAGAFAALARHRPNDPPFCMEFWDGWFDHWGRPHVVRAADDAARALEEILDAGGSVNLYMAHGGTNFGTGAGANHHDHAGADVYLPTVTSYDYDAPLDERGAPTEKFFAFRDVLERYRHGDGRVDLPLLHPLVSPVVVPLTHSADVVYTERDTFPLPPAFEDLGVDHGLVRYRTTVPGPREPLPLQLVELHDRAHVFVDDQLVAIVEGGQDQADLPAVGGPAHVDVIVESMGRVNYGPRIGGAKGLGGLRQDNQWLHGYAVAVHELPQAHPQEWSLTVTSPASTGPRYYRATIHLPEQADGYLEVPGGSKGYIWFNELCLGRYWNRGPQQRLYVPWPCTRAGDNTVTVLELDGLTSLNVSLHDLPAHG